jgi:hypothetical protein
MRFLKPIAYVLKTTDCRRPMSQVPARFRRIFTAAFIFEVITLMVVRKRVGHAPKENSLCANVPRA